MVLHDGLPKAARRRGRPVGADSAETRNQILRASRQVINERGYRAATFQAISEVAGLSRPTLHYYFASRLEIYRALVDEADVFVAGCIALALRQTTLGSQFSTFVAAIHDSDSQDRSQVAFLITARLESTRNPELRTYACGDVQDFLVTAVRGATASGELPPDTAIEAVVDMLHAILWGVGFHAGFMNDSADMNPMNRQLDHLFSHGLLSQALPCSPPSDTFDDTPSAVGGRP